MIRGYARSHTRWNESRQQGMFARRLHLDVPLLTGLCLLALVGLVILYSASGQDTGMVLRQSLRLAMGFAVMLVLAQIPAQHMERWAPWIYGGGIVLLLAVLLAGDIGKGAQRWLDLGVIRFQPSELMKLAVPLMIARHISAQPLPPKTKTLAVAAVLIIVPVLLIAKQPDLGTAILIAASGLIIILLSGVSWRLIGVFGTLCAALAPVLWYFMHDYQRQRVLTFLNPESDPLGTGYHIIQSKIAIGSGGLYGKGWLNGTQSRLEFIPESSTDFIFAVFAEEFGLIGVLLLFAIYLFIVIRCLFIATQAQTSFMRLLAGSLSVTFFVYIFVNVGMVSGLLPVVGVPLPLISYGGTSLVTLMGCFGILMSIQSHRKLLPS